MTAHVEIISFGYGHGPAPDAHITVDVRHHFKDPHVDPALRDLTAADLKVIEAVMDTPGVYPLVGVIAGAVRAFLDGPQHGPVTVAVGCVGGRHRSAAIAIEVARYLASVDGIPAGVIHRDMDRPVIWERCA